MLVSTLDYMHVKYTSSTVSRLYLNCLGQDIVQCSTYLAFLFVN